MSKKTVQVVFLLIAFLVTGIFQNDLAYSHNDVGWMTEPFQTAAGTTIYLPMIPNKVSNDWIVVDRYSVGLFDSIPSQYLTAARNLRMLFSNASVGDNINSGLDCFAAPSWAQSSNGCRRDFIDENWNWRLFDQTDLDNDLVPARILFTPDPVKYNRSNWTYVFRTAGDWNSATQEFIEVIAPAYLGSKDVLNYQFSYLDAAEISDITHPTEGFFGDNPRRYNIHDLEAFWAQHPSKKFFLTTTSLSRRTGSDVAVELNSQMRQYAQANKIPLLDLADILSHDESDSTCFDNRDGVLYCDQSGECENHPDDGLNVPAICRGYTTEIDAGHLGTVSAGRLRVAKAIWVLMARIAGWNP
jgi:hypothetical protein